MELLATAWAPYSTLPPEALASVAVLVIIGGAALIFAVHEIITRGTWNQRFHEQTSLGLGPVLRSHARQGRQSRKYTQNPSA